MVEMAKLNLNPGYEMLKCSMKFGDYHDDKVHKLIDKMNVAELQLSIMTNVQSKLSHAKSQKEPKDRKIDFSKDETLKKYGYLIHLRNPDILGNKIHNLPVEDKDLGQTLNKIVEEMRKEGIEGQIGLDAIFERFTCDHNIRFDVLDESTIDVVVQAIDAEIKMVNTDLNKVLMDISSLYDDRQSWFKNAHDGVKMHHEFIESVNRKTVR
jgi:hypothetical protein